ncbi:DUF7709 family protein [Neptunicella marina]|uniref:DUF7709 domain-containing protein n=1 Tax=Neptunicella marina TaxID=2125989 RepID=A0A8J6IUA0_9ALTE|nr:hypothetical protein [Neptunicella marina]MBC3765568.1 hypothetical protein [Neptunicella marina]
MQPSDLLPDNQNFAQINGVNVRKGTIGAFMLNCNNWLDPTMSQYQRAELEQEIRDSIPALKALGIFDFFQLKDLKLQQWLYNEFHIQ